MEDFISGLFMAAILAVVLAFTSCISSYEEERNWRDDCEKVGSHLAGNDKVYECRPKE